MISSAPRIGVFGGAFDPPHLAHVALVQAAHQQLGLDQVRVVPTGQAWHKARPLSDAQHRLAMARLAFGSIPWCVVDTCEIDRGGPSYTADTLAHLHAQEPRAQLFLLLGADQADTLPTWQRVDEVARLARLYVAPRAPAGGANLPTGVELHELQMAPLDVASTTIRQRLEHAQGVADLVPPAVARYIEQHCLYRNS